MVLIVASVISFIGSLQLGPVNLFVINTTLSRGKKAALFCALGGSLPEFIYCGAAVYAGDLFKENQLFNLILNYTFVSVLVLVALIFYFKEPIQTDSNDSDTIEKRPLIYVLKGFTLGVLNPQLLPFWLLVREYLNSSSLLCIQTVPKKMAFTLGAGAGAFFLLLFFVVMVQKHRQTIFKWINNKNYFKALSFTFLVLAVYETWKMFY